MKIKKSATLLAAASVLTVAGPAMAAPPYTVGVGPYTFGTHSWSAPAKGALNFTVSGPGGSVAWGCTTATLNGTVTAGANATGLRVGSIGSSTWSGCVGPGAMPMTYTQMGTWTLNLNGTATSGLTDNVTGYIGNISFNVSSSTPGLCSFRVTGRANAILRETPKTGYVQELEINQPTTGGNLIVSNVSGCFGAYANGNPMSLHAVFNLASPNGLINVMP